MKPDGTRRRQLKVGGLPCADWSFGPDRVFETRSPSWAPGGRRILFEYAAVVADRQDFAVAAADGSHRAVVPLAPPPIVQLGSQPESSGPEFRRSAPSFAPDGRHFAYVRTEPGLLSPPEIWIATVDGREDRRLGPGSLPRWAPDGRTLAYVAAQGREGGTWLMSASNGRQLRRLWRRSASSLDWAPDGRRLVASPSSSPGLYILRPSGKPARLLRSPSRRIQRQLREGGDAVWSPNGRRLAYIRSQSVPDGSGESGTRLEIWNVSTRGTHAKRIWKRDDPFDSDSPVPPPLSWQALQR